MELVDFLGGRKVAELALDQALDLETTFSEKRSLDTGSIRVVLGRHPTYGWSQIIFPVMGSCLFWVGNAVEIVNSAADLLMTLPGAA